MSEELKLITLKKLRNFYSTIVNNQYSSIFENIDKEFLKGEEFSKEYYETFTEIKYEYTSSIILKYVSNQEISSKIKSLLEEISISEDSKFAINIYIENNSLKISFVYKDKKFYKNNEEIYDILHNILIYQNSNEKEEEIKNFLERKQFNIYELTINTAQILGFKKSSDLLDIYCIPLWLYKYLDQELLVWSVIDNKQIKLKDIEEHNYNNCIPYGIKIYN